MAANGTGSSPYVGPHRLPSGRHNLPREYVLESQRDRIIAAMVALCSEKGYGGISITDLASRAGVSKTTFYELFRDKESCFLETYDTVAGPFVAEVIKACETDGLSWPEQLEFGLETALAHLSERPMEAKVIMVDVMVAGPVAIERYSAARRLLATNVDRGRGYAPENQDIPPGIAAAIVSGAALVIRQAILDGRAAELSGRAPDIIYWAFVPYLGQEEAVRRSEASRSRVAASTPAPAPHSFEAA